MAYQGSKYSDDEKEKYIDWLFELEYEKFSLPKPDAVVFLHVPLSFSQKLLETRADKDYIAGKRKDIHESNLDFLSKVYANYKFLSEKYSWKVVECVKDDALLSVDVISSMVYDSVIDIIRK